MSTSPTRNATVPHSRPWELALLPQAVQELIRPVISTEELFKHYVETGETHTTSFDDESYEEKRELKFEVSDYDKGKYQLYCRYDTKEERLTTLFKLTLLSPEETQLHYFESYLPLFEDRRDESYELPPPARELESLLEEGSFEYIHEALKKHLESEGATSSDLPPLEELSVFTDWRFREREVKVEHSLTVKQPDSSNKCLHYLVKRSSPPTFHHLFKSTNLCHKGIKWIREKKPLTAIGYVCSAVLLPLKQYQLFATTFALLSLTYLVDKSLDILLSTVEKKEHLPLLKIQVENFPKAVEAAKQAFNDPLNPKFMGIIALFLAHRTGSATPPFLLLGLVALWYSGRIGNAFLNSSYSASNSPERFKALVKDVGKTALRRFQDVYPLLTAPVTFCLKGEYRDALQALPTLKNPALNIIVTLGGLQALKQNIPSPLQIQAPLSYAGYCFLNNESFNPLIGACLPFLVGYFNSPGLGSFFSSNLSLFAGMSGASYGIWGLLKDEKTQRSWNTCTNSYQKKLEEEDKKQREKTIASLKKHMKEIDLCKEGEEDRAFEDFSKATSFTAAAASSSTSPDLAALLQKHASLWSSQALSDESGNVERYINLFISLGLDPKKMQDKEDKKLYFQELVNLSLNQGNVFQHSVKAIEKLWPLHVKLQNHKSYIHEFVSSTMEETQKYIFGSIPHLIDSHLPSIHPSLEPSGPISSLLTCLSYYGFTRYSSKLLNQYELYRLARKKSLVNNTLVAAEFIIGAYYFLRVFRNVVDYSNGHKSFLSVMKTDINKWMPSLKPPIKTSSNFFKGFLPNSLESSWQFIEESLLMILDPEELYHVLISLLFTMMTGSAINDVIDILIKHPFLQKLMDKRDKNTLKSFISFLPLLYILCRFSINYIDKSSNLQDTIDKHYKTFLNRRRKAYSIVSKDIQDKTINDLAVNCILSLAGTSVVKILLLDRISCFKSGLPNFLKTLFIILPSTYYVTNYLSTVYERIRREEEEE